MGFQGTGIMIDSYSIFDSTITSILCMEFLFEHPRRYHTELCSVARARLHSTPPGHEPVKDFNPSGELVTGNPQGNPAHQIEYEATRRRD